MANGIAVIYGIKFTSSDKYVYVGSTVNFPVRQRKHRFYLEQNKHPNKRLQELWNNHREPGVEFVILEECLEIQRLDIEAGWISRLRKDNDLCNVVDPRWEGHWLGHKHTEEAKQKVSQANKGRRWSDSEREKRIGRIQSQEEKDKRSESMRNQARCICPICKYPITLGKILHHIDCHIAGRSHYD